MLKTACLLVEKRNAEKTYIKHLSTENDLSYLWTIKMVWVSAKVTSKFECSTRTVGRMLKSLKNQSDDQENKKAKENNFAKGLCSTKMPFHVHEVLKKGVVSFINKYHSRDQYIDLHCDIKSTSSHYANSVQDWLEEPSINFFAK